MPTYIRILVGVSYEALWIAGYLAVPTTWNGWYALVQFICTFPVIFWALWGHWPWVRR